MFYHEPSKEEHETVVKQIRSYAKLNFWLLTPVIPLTLLAVFLSINMMRRDDYDQITFLVSTVLLILFFLAVVFFIGRLVLVYFRRMQYIGKQKYTVAYCEVCGKDQIVSPRRTRSYVTVRFMDGNTIRAFVSNKVYYLAENGKKALAAKYEGPANAAGKMPIEIAICDS